MSHSHHFLILQKFTPESINFQSKILARSGLGDDTYLPPGLAQQPPAISMSDARWEFEQVSRHSCTHSGRWNVASN
jgi:hypothetical protein